MTQTFNSKPSDEQISSESPRLVTVLKEMKEGLDNVRNKIEALTSKVKAGLFPTSDGISYLEVKHLLLLNYCQSLVYYLLRKAKGLPIQGHPVVTSLVEIRIFLEKIRPVDRKMQYQIQKLTNASATTMETSGSTVKEADKREKVEDLLTYRPNPNLLMIKRKTSEVGPDLYVPPKFTPTVMAEDKLSKQEKNALRKETQMLRQSNQSIYVRELMDDLEGKPEEIRESGGVGESREATRYMAEMEERMRQEEEHFTRAPITKAEKKKLKHLTKSRNGLLGLTESVYDEIKSFSMDGSAPEEMTSFNDIGSGDRKFKRRKRKH